MKTKIVLFIMLCVACVTLHAQTEGSQDSNFAMKVKMLFHVDGSEEAYSVVIENLVDAYKNQYSSAVDASYFDKLKAKMLDSSLDDLIEMLIPVYQKHFTESDIDELIAFYKTDIGKKLAKERPAISTESIEIGQLWGRKIAQEILDDINDH